MHPLEAVYSEASKLNLLVVQGLPPEPAARHCPTDGRELQEELLNRGLLQPYVHNMLLLMLCSWSPADGRELVEEYDKQHRTLLLRKRRAPGGLGAQGSWQFLTGEEIANKSAPTAPGIRESSANVRSCRLPWLVSDQMPSFFVVKRRSCRVQLPLQQVDNLRQQPEL